MATVTKTVTVDSVVYTISSIYAAIAINSLFNYRNIDASFRYSLNSGVDYSLWYLVTDGNIRLIDIEPNNENVVVQISTSLVTNYLLINTTDKLLINATDNLKITD